MAITPKVGQRYHYSDCSQDGILEIVEFTGSDYRLKQWNIRFIQYFGRSFFEIGEIVPFTVNDGTWVYLEGQDRP